MYFLQQIKKQISNNIIAYNNPLEAGGGAEQVDTRAKEPMGPDDVRHLSTDAHDAAKASAARADGLEARETNLTGGEGDETVVGDDGNDTMTGNETNTVHPDSVGTATMEDAKAVATRNGLDGAGSEEPPVGEDGQETPAPEPSPEELARRQQSLEADRARTQARIDQYKPGTPERQAAEKEMSAIQMFMNIIAHGSINPPAGAVDGQGNPIEGGNSYGGGIGAPLSPELLRQYGGTGHELASWLQQRGFPVFEGQPNYCGRNVGEAMNAFGYLGLPSGGRNGADWKTICEQRPSQFKKIDCRPQDAPAGALISYARNSGGSDARKASGHIEIALGEGKGYYYGAVASQPGGSQKPPREGSYTIFMPTSKTQRSVA